MSETKSQEPGYMVIDPIIWQDASLNDREKILLSFVWGFTRVQKGCWASADWIAMNFGWDYPFTTQLIHNTRMRGWIYLDPDGCMSISIPGEKSPCDGDITDVFDLGEDV